MMQIDFSNMPMLKNTGSTEIRRNTSCNVTSKDCMYATVLDVAQPYFPPPTRLMAAHPARICARGFSGRQPSKSMFVVIKNTFRICCNAVCPIVYSICRPLNYACTVMLQCNYCPTLSKIAIIVLKSIPL